MRIPVYYLDAFTTKLFSGNPAAVCPLKFWISDEQMQLIAAENCLSETAFFVPQGPDFELRWFTPKVEVDLCGHATLASSYVIFEYLGYSERTIRFKTKSGDLLVEKQSDQLTLNFPSRVVEPCQPTQELLSCFEKQPREFFKSGTSTYIAVMEKESDVQLYQPDFSRLLKVDRSLNITAPGDTCDFVSRYFAPNKGIPEDPVTGSAHCGLSVYWSKRLNRGDVLHARQISKRTGDLYCQLQGDRVLIAGSVVPYMSGVIFASKLSAEL